MQVECVFTFIKLAVRLIVFSLLCKGLGALVRVPHFHKGVNKLIGFVLLSSNVTILCRSHFSVQVLQVEGGGLHDVVFVLFTSRNVVYNISFASSTIVDKSCRLMFLLHVPTEGLGSLHVSSVVGYKLRMVHLTSATLCV